MATTAEAVRGNGAGHVAELGTDLWTSPTPAVHGREVGEVTWTGADRGMALARLLGWFSVGLGVAEVLAPRSVARVVGLRPTRTSTTVLRLAGLREIGHGLGILANPRSKEWVGTRLGGDVLDLALLGVTLVAAREKGRAVAATTAVLGVGALDLLTFETLLESRRARTAGEAEGPGKRVRRSVTILASTDEVHAAWLALEKDVDLYDGGGIRVTEAANGRGTVVTVEIPSRAPGGRIGAAARTLVRRDSAQELDRDLRRLKQIVEAGHEVRARDAGDDR